MTTSMTLFIAIYIAKTKALLPTVWSVPNVSYKTVNLTTIVQLKNKANEVWRGITLSEVQDRIADMPNRCKLVAKHPENRIKGKKW